MITGYSIFGLLLTLGIIWGIKLMSSPQTAVKGNLIGAGSMLGAVILTLVYNEIIGSGLLWLAILVGGAIGSYLAHKVEMIQMPQMVALLNGFGGGASALVASIMLFSNFNQLNPTSRFSSGLALMVGAITLSGSLIAAAKLDRRMEQKSIVLKGHSFFNFFTLVIPAISVILITFKYQTQIEANLFIFLILLSALAFGVIFAIRVGGADMPITISLLNSMSGLAASIAGFAIYNPLLVVVGAVVGASGLILTQIMCRAMNRSLFEVLAGNTKTKKEKKNQAFTELVKAKKSTSKAELNLEVEVSKDLKETAEFNLASKIEQAESIMIVPGYGMALAQAQTEVKKLYDKLETAGKEVNFAIHPVAGRMPGHMNVLLAEVNIPYDKLLELEVANPKLKETDLAIVIGANDVINPAAKTAEGTPIYGMPILDIEEAAEVMILNLDQKPGYAGVDNPLYTNEKVEMLLGDAKESLKEILADLEKTKTEVESAAENVIEVETASLIKKAEKIMIVPGYGMALAQAQTEVKELYDKLETAGKEVNFAIHPVAGRMPGHMNVLLAEVNIPYDKLLELEVANPKLKETDLAIVIGANDVINPAAKTAEGTPIYGMPILDIEEAAEVMILNLDQKPGYAGVDNPLYTNEKVEMLLGDAKKSLKEILAEIE
ncbi:NAD(P)(+) transhydrogenase (Re/Si-specific) subunit beta [Halanaerobium praevalens]|uniref:proton-translocating NAD(P)(+) transhydrogenase n=1 Tax=Halanaerobium praevalens (strain ATCC 33744 / DSM 2228 / GSL) TaxID=572479 RepID=E3DNI0_HALPG|nr:NAD(P)(+) transhydrogenase (Re/Si-specific) subunit beta [Halanaerobium praevalens]ADO76518.1 NAD(P)(+) transhydrogenase (AB-specific) [Halanaerobium praevalens DSM 2228]